jgi:PrgI family protein
MATYKVLQDIEAEDKLLGPLTLRQFIYAGIFVGLLYMAFLMITSGVGLVAPIFVVPALLFGFLAFPWKGEQPTEVWALAKVGFYIKPRKRIWNQSGVKQLVTITVPKQVQHTFTKGLTETEVKSRLQALASTIDSRGWAIKNVNASTYGQPGLFSGGDVNSDRLVGVSSLPQPVSDALPQPEDMLDLQNSRVAQQFDSMIAASAKAHRQQIVDRLQDNQPTATPPAPTPPTAQPAAPTNNYWFLDQPAQGASTVPQDTVTFNTQVVAPGSSTAALPVTSANPTPDEEQFIKKLKSEPAFSPNMHGHMHVIQPLSAQKTTPPGSAQATVPAPATPKVTQAPDPAIVELARNDDLNVATIAREAQKRKEPPDEVVISLH